MIVNDKILQDIINTHYNNIRLFIFCRVYYNELYTDEITSNVFYTLYLKRGLIENGNIKSWLYKTAEYKIKEFYRELIKQGKYEDIDNYSDSPEAGYNFDSDEYMRYIEKYINISKCRDEIISSLRNDELKLYKFIYEDKLKYARIAENFNTTESAIKMKAVRLHKKLDKKIHEIIGVLLNIAAVIIRL
jgi:DNA-directed RNA polymerase specialized sigma24 family protein